MVAPLLVFVFALLTVVHAEDVLPLTEKPATLQADDLDRFYLDYGQRVIRWTTEQDRVFTYEIPPEWGASFEHYVAPKDGTIHSLQRLSQSQCIDKECTRTRTTYRVVKWRCPATGECRSSQLASWSRTTGQKGGTSYSFRLKVTEQGTPLLRTTRRQSNGEKSTSTTTYLCGKKNCERDQWRDQYFEEMDVVPTYRITENGDHLYGPGLKAKRTKLADKLLEAMANVDKRAVYDRTGTAHIFRYNGGTKSFVRLRVDDSSGEPTVREDLIDSAEAGASNAAVRVGEGLITFHYFYRNSYYKGVRATWFPDGSGAPAWQIDIDQGQDVNPGWKLEAAATKQGRVLVGYLSDPKAKDAQYLLRLFDSKDAIAEVALPEPTDWTAKKKLITGMAGVGTAWQMWQLGSATPDDEEFDDIELFDPDLFLMDASYEVSPAWMAEATIMARIGRFSLGASYGQQLLTGALEDAGLSGGQINRLFGVLGVDQIFKYHDIRLNFRQSRVDTRTTIEPRELDTFPVALLDLGFAPIQPIEEDINWQYTRTDVYLLNTWRVRYGVMVQLQTMYLPIYGYTIQEGDTEWSFAGGGPSLANLSDVAITVGYSQLDYAAKYENNVGKFFLDGDVGIGVTTANLLDDVTLLVPEGDDVEEVDRASDLLLMGQAEAGYLLQRRSKKLRGLGVWARGGYRVEGFSNGSAAFPGEEDEPVEEDNTRVSFSRYELRHGPFVQGGLVF